MEVSSVKALHASFISRHLWPISIKIFNVSKLSKTQTTGIPPTTTKVINKQRILTLLT